MNNQSIGYTNGYYDLFHVGHLRLLERAAALCDKLIVGVIHEQVSILTKSKKPIIPMKQRMEIIQGLSCVDMVVPVLADDKFHEWLNYRFDKLFVGSDHQNTQTWDENESHLGRSCQIIYLPRTEGVSTGSLLKQIRGTK